MDEWMSAPGVIVFWLDDLPRWSRIKFMEAPNYTIRRNLNRGYLRLQTWQRAMDLFEAAWRLGSGVSDFKLKSQFVDAAQSVSANIAEGNARRTLPDYLHFLYIAKGSLAEALTRACGLWRTGLISAREFEQFDKLHYEVENKLLHLIYSLEGRRGTAKWNDSLPRHVYDQNPDERPNT